MLIHKDIVIPRAATTCVQCFIFHVHHPEIVAIFIVLVRPPCVTGSSDTQKTFRKSRTAKSNQDEAKHVFDVLIPNWASISFEFPKRTEITNILEAENCQNEGGEGERPRAETVNSVIKSNGFERLRLPDPSKCASAFRSGIITKAAGN